MKAPARKRKAGTAIAKRKTGRGLAKRAAPERAVSIETQMEVASLRRQVAEELGKRNHTAGINLQLGDIGEEYVDSLKSLRDRTRVFERMSNDPQIRGQLRAIMMTLISGVRFSVKGGSKEMRDLISANFLRKGPAKWWASSSWLDFLYEVMGCLIYGFSPFGLSWAPAIDGRVVLSDMTWLHPRSWDEDGWDMDEFDNLIGVRRSYQDNLGISHVRERIEARDLFMVCWDRRGPNWEGNAFIRPMYRPWKLGEYAEKIDIIDLQNRGVGIPMAKLSGQGGTKERDTLVSMLKSMRGGSKDRAFVVIGADEEISFLTSEGNVREAASTLAHHRANKATAAGTEYFEQGNTGSGSRAGASALATGFFINVDAVRIVMMDQINNGPGRMKGIVQRVIEMNFSEAEIDRDGYPEIIGSRVSPTEQLDNIPLLGEMVQKGVIPPNRKLSNDVSVRLGYDELDEKEWDDALAAQNVLVEGRGGGSGRPADAGDDPKGRDDEDSNRLKMTSDAQKKNLIGENLPPRNPESWRWLKSRPA